MFPRSSKDAGSLPTPPPRGSFLYVTGTLLPARRQHLWVPTQVLTRGQQ